MTATLLLLAAASQAEPIPGEISGDTAIARARERAVALGFKVADATGEAERRAPVSGPVWRVVFPGSAGVEESDADPRLVVELDRRSGRLKALRDTTFAGREMKGWTPRISRPQARARTIAVGRTLGVPASWVVGRTAFDGVGKNRWPQEAHVTFEERPLGYRYLVAGNHAVVRLNPRTGALVGYELVDDFRFERAAIRLRADQAATIARRWRTTERTDPRPRVEGGVRLGWGPTAPGARTARLVFDVPFRIESHMVDANNGRVLGTRRTKVVVY